MATDEEVEDQKERVLELRARLEEARTGGAEHQKAVENDMVLAQLQAEEARLQAELDVAEQRAKPSVVEQGAAAPLATAKDQMAAAVAHQKSVAAEILQSAKERNPSPIAPTDADSTNTTTESQATNLSPAAETQAGVKNKAVTEGASK